MTSPFRQFFSEISAASYKPDIGQHFYLQHALNTGLQLEELPENRVVIHKEGKTDKVKNHKALEPVLTLIWLADEALRF